MGGLIINVKSLKIGALEMKIINNEWETPDPLFKLLNDEFEFNFDVCASDWNAKCDEYFTAETDALKNNWPLLGTGWMNPPYGNNVQKFMEKAYEQTKKMACKIVCLVPANTETKWFHEIALMGEIRFIRGRVHFKDKNGKTGRPRFASMIVILDPDNSGSGKIKNLCGYIGGK